MKIQEPSCSLCGAVSDAAPRPPENTRLYETANFVVMPAIGPLLPGHILVVSRGHYPSLGAMGQTAIAEYESLARQFRESTIFSSKALEVEHGGTNDDCGAACVLHTHIHWIPGLGEYETAFEGIHPLIDTGNDVKNLTQVTVPYLLLRGTSGKIRLHSAKDMPSQILRQVICTQLGRQDWDWKQSRHEDWINETVEMWNLRGIK